MNCDNDNSDRNNNETEQDRKFATPLNHLVQWHVPTTAERFRDNPIDYYLCVAMMIITGGLVGFAGYVLYEAGKTICGY